MKNETNSKRIRIAVIDFKKCSPQKCGFQCISVCPVNRLGKECITKSTELKPVISEVLCTGCKICVHKCPFNAISIVNLSAELHTPIHQFGKNGFRLYGLPVPAEKQVVGLIGRNGIGKSTALKILSGKIIPNLGETKKNYEEIKEFFKGKELQAFFEKLSLGKIRVSLKPQAISKIPESFNGTVGELLEQFNESGKLPEIVKRMGLSGVLSSNISNISGGELQRLAIAAAMLKEADVY